MDGSSSTLKAAAVHAQARRARERRALRALGLPLLLIVVVPSLTVAPHAALHGSGLAVLLGLVATTAAFLVVQRRAPRLDAEGGGEAGTLLLLVLMAAGAVALIAAQPSGTGELGVSLVAWIAGIRLPVGVGLGIVVAAGVAAAVAVGLGTAHSVESVVTTGMLVALLFLMARLYRSAQRDRERAELAAAELEDAREYELRSAALAERARIARDLHDVLAHSLSGLSLQLEGARLMAERESASAELRESLARARRLAADGVEEARRAVRALQGAPMPDLRELAALVEGSAHNGLRVELSIEGEPRPVPSEAALAVYRAVQEALTNISRHSGADRAQVAVLYGEGRIAVVVSDNGGGRAPAIPALAAAGTGYGLSAMRERVALLGGRVETGPTDEGFRIALELPA